MSDTFTASATNNVIDDLVEVVKRLVRDIAELRTEVAALKSAPVPSVHDTLHLRSGIPVFSPSTSREGWFDAPVTPTVMTTDYPMTGVGFAPGHDKPWSMSIDVK